MVNFFFLHVYQKKKKKKEYRKYISFGNDNIRLQYVIV